MVFMEEFMKDILKDRDATDKYKGFRYQKIRLAKRMLELLKEDKKANIIAIPEYKDDGFYIDKDGEHTLEQNKEYSKDFTLNSEEIKKSIINFIDYYMQSEFSKHIHFVFYTNVSYSKEGKSAITKRMNLELLEKPIMEYLVKKELSDEVVEFISKFLIEAYRIDYGIKEDAISTYTTNYKKIVAMNKEEWVIFLKSINFQFGQVDLEMLEEEIEKEIRSCEFFSLDYLDKIETIKAKILEDIDKKMTQKDWIQRIINRDTIKLIYLESKNSVDIFKVDKSYKMWDMIEENYKDNTYRNIEEKIKAVTPQVSKKILIRYNLAVTNGNIDIEDLSKNNEKSLRVRIYQAMNTYFSLKFKQKQEYGENEIKNIIDDLQKYVLDNIKDLKEDFSYGIKNNTIINELVLMLIDECFYAFDGN